MVPNIGHFSCTCCCFKLKDQIMMVLAVLPDLHCCHKHQHLTASLCIFIRRVRCCIVYAVPTFKYLLLCARNMHATLRERKKRWKKYEGKKTKKPPSLIFLLIPLGVMNIYSRKYSRLVSCEWFFRKNNFSKVL